MKGNGLLQNFTTLSVEGCAKSVGQNAALENKPFITCAQSDNVQGTLHKKARMSLSNQTRFRMTSNREVAAVYT